MDTGNPKIQRLLLGYSVLVTTVLAAFTVSQAVSETKPGSAKFDQIEVRRINVREADGTLRMTISSADAAPGVIVRGKEQPHPQGRAEAGMIFFNAEGTENGGLIFGGSKKDGKVSGFGHLSFDQYDQDQVISLDQSEENGSRRAGLSFSDRPDSALPWDRLREMNKPEVRAEMEKLAKAGGFGYSRLFIGKSEDRAATMVLKDARGRPRLVMKVAPEGAASIDFLDENGKPVRTLTPAAAK